MFNSKDYRAKAAEHQNRARASHNADEISEHRKLERTFSAVNVREIDEFPLRLG
jgi:hypothetical protein